MSDHDAADAPGIPTFNPFDPGYFESGDLRRFGFRSVGDNVRVAKNATLIGLQNISLGSNVRIDGNTVIAAHTGSIELGSYIHIGGDCYLGCAGGIVLEDFCGLSQGVRVYSGTDDYTGRGMTNPTVPAKYLRPCIGQVVLERHVIVGSGSVVLPGVRIGEGASIGALSLVTKSLDDWGVYFGAPVRRLKSRSKALLDLEKALLREGGA
jgi:acetyltransferase-like isoleucine patch superfamily enzyme